MHGMAQAVDELTEQRSPAFETAMPILSQFLVAIGRALLLQPDIMLMDEPSTGLAPKVVKDILDVLGRLRADGMSIILVEQNIAICAPTA